MSTRIETQQHPAAAVEAILARKSVRQFLPDPVPPDLVRKVLDLGRRAPSWTNTQPWEVVVVSGSRLAVLKDALAATLTAEIAPNPDIAPPRFPDLYLQRRRENGLRLFGLLGITREAVEKRVEYDRSMLRFFEAPVVLVFLLDRALGPWSMLDLGAFMQTVMLAAVAHGLGTIPMARHGRYPDVLRKHLRIPESKMVLCVVAIGYEDKEAAVNRFRSNRVPLEEIVSWCTDEEQGAI